MVSGEGMPFRHRASSPGIQRVFQRGFLHCLVLVLAALYLVPALYVVSLSLRSPSEVFATPPSVVPTSFRWQNFVQAWQSAAFGVYFLNSVVVAGASTMLQVALSCLAGYGLARFRFRSREAILFLIIIMLIIPPEVTVVPLFVLVKSVPLAGGNGLLGGGGTGLLNTYLGLMVPHLISPLAIFLMRQFYLNLPAELGEAARLDGASEWTIMWRVFTPLVKPGVFTVAIFAFQGAWNDFFWPLVITKSDNMKTLQLGLTGFFQQNASQWAYLMAAVIITTIPVLLLFGFGQRTFVRGILIGGVKS